MNRLGQMTVTIIISILVLSMFAITFYLTGNAVEQKIDTSVTKQQQGQEALKPMKDYVQQCIDQLGARSLELIGKQGGRIYATLDQQGLTPDPFQPGIDHAVISTSKVAIGIGAPVGSLGPIFKLGTPQYPWHRFPYTGANDVELMTGYYGLNKLPAITGTGSVAEAMEQFMKVQLPVCADWTIFEGRDFTVQTEEPVVKVTLADADVRIAVSYPVKVSNKATGLHAELDKFESTFPVRLNKLLNFSHAVVERDISDLAFVVHGVQSTNDASVMSVEVDRQPSIDIIKVKDPKSRLAGSPYVFQFARQNRQPVLYYLGSDAGNPAVASAFSPLMPYCIGSTITVDPANPAITITSKPGADPAAGCTGQGTIPLGAQDPDEDEVTYNVTRVIDSQQVPFTIESQAMGGTFTVTVSDGVLSDEQEVTIPVEGAMVIDESAP